MFLNLNACQSNSDFSSVITPGGPSVNFIDEKFSSQLSPTTFYLDDN